MAVVGSVSIAVGLVLVLQRLVLAVLAVLVVAVKSLQLPLQHTPEKENLGIVSIATNSLAGLICRGIEKHVPVSLGLVLVLGLHPHLHRSRRNLNLPLHMGRVSIVAK